MKILKEIPGYNLTEKLYESSRTLVYRGVKIDDNLPVVLKILTREFPLPSELDKMTNEYIILSNTSTGGAIRFYDLINIEHRKAIVMEDIGGISLENYFNDKTPDIAEVLEITISIAKILGDLHKHNIIHKDINPSNIIINPETKTIKLIDFSISSLIQKEVRSAINPEKLEGTLAYISPEQTGRMNRIVDFRTDFYSLGVTLFRMATGRPPFIATEAMALIHSHIAIMPPSPNDLNTDVPKIISDIIIKLLSKTAEDRYQSAFGLISDLEKCYHAIKYGNRNKDFELGKVDISESLIIPEKLYGREEETRILFDKFNETASGKTNIIFITGPSGVGKSFLINEIHKPLVMKRGLFASGKFDRLQKGIPYYSFIQAFQDLIQQIMTGSEEKISDWKTEILEAVGENGQIIIDIIPELELIIGQQPKVSELNSNESQNRFNHVFQNFIKSFCNEKHPLVLFLDDLQWADNASLKLLNLILCDRRINYFLFLGAYRDNEVQSGDSLMMLFDEFIKMGIGYEIIPLRSFEVSHINQMLVETLFRTPEDTKPLSVLVKIKTDGNPFFVKEFIINLYKENFITFNDRWYFNMENIISANVTDNVIVLMSDRVKKLMENAQNVLKIASCIGVNSDLNIVAQIYGQPEETVLGILNEAINEGMIIKFENNLKFVHDRVRDSVYSIIDKKSKIRYHYNIGKILLSNIPEDKIDDNIFFVTHQLNSAIELIIDQKEKIQLAKFNLLAGVKAKSSTAYEEALEFFRHGISLLPHDAWLSNYDLILSLYTEIGEIGYILGKHEFPDEYFNKVLLNAKTALDKIKIYEVKMAINTSLHNIQEALKWGKDVLKLLDINMPSKANPIFVMKELFESKIRLLGKNIEDLIEIPTITDPRRIAIVRILMACTEPAYIGDPGYFPIVTLKLFNQTLKYGNSIYAAYAYVFYGVISSSVLGSIETGYRFGKLGLKAVEKFNANSLKSKVLFLFSGMINHWKNHMSESINYLLEGFRVGTETGDLAFSSYSINYYVSHLFFMGKTLLEVKNNYQKYYEAIKRTKQLTAIQAYELSFQMVINLSESMPDTSILKGDIFNEDITIPLWLKYNDMTSYSFYVVGKEILYYFSGLYDQAVQMAVNGKKSLGGMLGMIHVPHYYYYYTLSMLAVFIMETKNNQKKYITIIKKNIKLMKKWSVHASMNYEHKYLLLEAELARIKSDTKNAMALYSRAIDQAARNGFLQDEAIACELAAKFYLSKGMQKFASSNMTRAHNCYNLWGAKLKTNDLERKYEYLIMK